MKTLVTLLLMTATIAFASVRAKKFTYTVSADSEAAVLAEIEDAIPQILSGDIKSVFQKNCWPNNARTIKVKNVTTNKVYSYANGALVEKFVGTVNYLHKRCRDTN